jgi:CheY-like chemotaxis protein
MRTAPPCILVVDDSEDLRDALVETLSEEGCEVLAVGGGAQALLLLESGARPHLILLDLLMPQMNGDTFLERLRAVRDYDAVDVVLMSAALVSAPPGIQGQLRKPFELKALLALVDRYGAAQGGARQLVG